MSEWKLSKAKEALLETMRSQAGRGDAWLQSDLGFPDRDVLGVLVWEGLVEAVDWIHGTPYSWRLTVVGLALPF